MRKNFVSYFVFFGCFFISLSPCVADFATPFVEINNKIGDVSVTHAHVAALGPDMGSRFLVIVMSDQMQFVVLRATAKQGVVKESLLGREISIRAKVTKTRSATNKPELEILHVELLTAKVEQDGADQPATAQERTPEGEEKPNPESEGRSQ